MKKTLNYKTWCVDLDFSAAIYNLKWYFDTHLENCYWLYCHLSKMLICSHLKGALKYESRFRAFVQSISSLQATAPVLKIY